MKEKYGPEDLEQLLEEKQYEELLPEERQYVLKHIDGKEEYDLMRDTLFAVLEPGSEVDPPAALRQELIAKHRSHHARPRFTIWLNSIAAFWQGRAYVVRPALQLAGLALVLGGVFWVLSTNDPALESDKIVQQTPSEQDGTPNSDDAMGLEDDTSSLLDEENEELNNDLTESDESKALPSTVSTKEEEFGSDHAVAGELDIMDPPAMDESPLGEQSTASVEEQAESLAEVIDERFDSDVEADDSPIVDKRKDEEIISSRAVSPTTASQVHSGYTSEAGDQGARYIEPQPVPVELIELLYTAR
ncbi:MAG: hypothetical protein HKN79_06940 [Flavobacteriales bacterium]|nr:hypothetical protein [Flavobacteriales bacterium]